MRTWRRDPTDVAVSAWPSGCRLTNDEGGALTWTNCLTSVAIRVAVAAALLLGGVFGLMPAEAATANRSTKGSSCAHPYRVEWVVYKNGKEFTHRWFGPETKGDTSFITVHGNYDAIGLETGYFHASWKPRVGGLKLCLARLTFDYREPYVSHQWHPSSVAIFYDPHAEHKYIASFVVTAAR